MRSRFFIIGFLFLFSISQVQADGVTKTGVAMMCAGALGALASFTNLVPSQHHDALMYSSAAVMGLGFVVALSGSPGKSKSRRNSKRQRVHQELQPYYDAGQVPPYQPYTTGTSVHDLLTSPWYWYYEDNVWHPAFEGIADAVVTVLSAKQELPQIPEETVRRIHSDYLTSSDYLESRIVDDADHDGIPDNIDDRVEVDDTPDADDGGSDSSDGGGGD